MRILLTNDDGVHAPGLKILETIARQFSDDIFVIAPEIDQSGVAHSLSLNNPLRLREISPRHFAVQGTPTDCVILGASTEAQLAQNLDAFEGQRLGRDVLDACDAVWQKLRGVTPKYNR